MIERQMKTYMAKPGEVEQRWWVVDASGHRVGRLASELATVLMGKHRPTYTPHVDTGDHVIVINADKVEFSGKKWQQKLYRWYTGYQGLKTETAEHRRDRRPELIVEEAVRTMLREDFRKTLRGAPWQVFLETFLLVTSTQPYHIGKVFCSH